MKANEFEKIIENFCSTSLKAKTTTSVFLISANSENFTAKINGYPRQIKDSLVVVLVDNPDLIKVFDGACRRARAILKLKNKNEDIPQAR